MAEAPQDQAQDRRNRGVFWELGMFVRRKTLLGNDGRSFAGARLARTIQPSLVTRK